MNSAAYHAYVNLVADLKARGLALTAVQYRAFLTGRFNVDAVQSASDRYHAAN